MNVATRLYSTVDSCTSYRIKLGSQLDAHRNTSQHNTTQSPWRAGNDGTNVPSCFETTNLSNLSNDMRYQGKDKAAFIQGQDYISSSIQKSGAHYLVLCCIIIIIITCIIVCRISGHHVLLREYRSKSRGQTLRAGRVIRETGFVCIWVYLLSLVLILLLLGLRPKTLGKAVSINGLTWHSAPIFFSWHNLF